jgi:ribonuclease J
MFSYWDANELFDLTQPENNYKTRYISASTEPFSEEMEIDEAKMLNWMDFFEIAYDYDINDKGQKEFTRRHVSGHASKPELKELIEKINPVKIIPIHTTNLKQFEEMFGVKVVIANYAQPIEV